MADGKPDQGSATGELVVTRVFAAPRDLVFKAWTESDRLAKWWGPRGFTMLSCKNDLRPGGVFLYGMRSPDGHEMWGKWVYREIIVPERLVFVASFADPQGNITRHPLAPTWPHEVLSTVTFTDEDGQTKLTMRGIPINATDVECKTFLDNLGGMQKGWKGTFDQLDDYLANPAC